LGGGGEGTRKDVGITNEKKNQDEGVGEELKPSSNPVKTKNKTLHDSIRDCWGEKRSVEGGVRRGEVREDQKENTRTR